MYPSSSSTPNDVDGPDCALHSLPSTRLGAPSGLGFGSLSRKGFIVCQTFCEDLAMRMALDPGPMCDALLRVGGHSYTTSHLFMSRLLLGIGLCLTHLETTVGVVVSGLVVLRKDPDMCRQDAETDRQVRLRFRDNLRLNDGTIGR